ncbi:MAG: recombination regulator RecX [Actinomycetota bacterium]|nr:recombination regulator RecX [Actinomycetota bacterium]
MSGKASGSSRGRRIGGSRGGRRRREDEPTGGHPEDPPGDPESVARSICLKLLTMSPKTRAQLADALAVRGIPEHATEAVLDRYVEVGLIDDVAFAQAWVTTRQAGRGLATRALAQELHRKGIDKHVAGAALALLAPDAEEAAARRLVQRKLRSMSSLAPTVATRRLLGMLARKGYPSEVSLRVIREALEGCGPLPPSA